MSQPGKQPLRLGVIGPAGCGKTAVGSALAAQLGLPFVDADDLHPAANRARMAAGVPLDDDARRPWLAAIVAHLTTANGFVLACSALKQRYRDQLAAGLPGLRFVVLQVAADELARRLRQRVHFFPPSLLADQLATWEPPADGVEVAAQAPVADVVATILRLLADGR